METPLHRFVRIQRLRGVRDRVVGELPVARSAEVLELAHPADASEHSLWQRNTWVPEPYGNGGAQIYANDIDGDGDADILTSKNAHGYGLAWFEQVKDAVRSVNRNATTPPPVVPATR